MVVSVVSAVSVVSVRARPCPSVRPPPVPLRFFLVNRQTGMLLLLLLLRFPT